MSCRGAIQIKVFEVRPSEKLTKPKLVESGAPLWTAEKASLIDEHIHCLLLVTRHGVCLDLFADPQRVGDTDRWSVRRVLERRDDLDRLPGCAEPFSRASRVAALEHRQCAASVRGGVGEVTTGGKPAPEWCRQHNCRDLEIAFKVPCCIGQLLDCAERQGVERIAAVEGDDRDPPFSLDGHVVVGHRFRASRIWRLTGTPDRDMSDSGRIVRFAARTCPIPFLSDGRV